MRNLNNFLKDNMSLYPTSSQRSGMESHNSKPNRRTRRVAIGSSIALAVMFLPTVAAETSTIEATDYVAVSFWIATAMMLASTVFFLVERNNVPEKWKTSMTVAALVTGVAWYHYTYMREHWVITGESPLVLRYIDWLITVPLQVVEFYLILAAIGVGTAIMFQRLLGASIVMLVAGYFGESGAWDVFGDSSTEIWFVIGMAGWAWILYELHGGEVGAAAESGSAGVQYGFNAMKWIVTVGWAIYPLGYMMGNGFFDGMGTDDMNILYNIADLVNKTAFGMMIWYAAKHDE